MSNKFKIDTLQNQLEKMQAQIEKREDLFENRSEKWQESEKGVDHETRTSELQQFAEDLENLIDSINEWNEEY